jgi:hypothetical protein
MWGKREWAVMLTMLADKTIRCKENKLLYYLFFLIKIICIFIESELVHHKLLSPCLLGKD